MHEFDLATLNGGNMITDDTEVIAEIFNALLLSLEQLKEE